MKTKRPNNALTHGLYARDTVLPWEDPDAFAAHHQAIRHELQPAGPLEESSVREIAELEWRKQRLAMGALLPFYKDPPPAAMIEAARGDLGALAAYLADPANPAHRSFLATSAQALDYIKRQLKNSSSPTAEPCAAVDVPGTPTSSSIERAYDAGTMERQLKAEAMIDNRIAKVMSRLIWLKEYKRAYGQQSVQALPLAAAPAVAPPAEQAPAPAPPVESPAPAANATPNVPTGADLYR